MPRRPKAFDPLSSLFEPPPADAGTDEVPITEERPSPAFPPTIELTDPFFSAPEEGPQAPSRRILGPRGPAARTRLTSGDPDITAPEEAEPPLPVRPAAPPPAPVGLPVSVGALPADLAIGEPAAPVSAPPPPEPLPADPVALARALARAAVARAGPPSAARPRDPAPATEPAAPCPPPPPPPPPRPPMSRVEALSQRAVRPRSALELMQQAEQEARSDERRAEEKRRQAEERQSTAPPPTRPVLVQKMQRLLERKLRGLGPFTVSNCLLMDDREILRALWRAHRARFGAEGQLDQVVAAAAVLDALDLVPAGKLLAAHVLTDASDYLVWVDLREGTPLAAFANARAYFVGAQGE